MCQNLFLLQEKYFVKKLHFRKLNDTYQLQYEVYIIANRFIDVITKNW